MKKTVTAGVAGVADYLRRRPEMALFGLGVVLFAGGLASVISGQLSPRVAPRALEPTSQPSAGPKTVRVGPAMDEPVRPYIQGKKALLSRLATESPRESTLAMIVFDSYRKVSEVEALLDARALHPIAMQMRVPLPVFRPVEVVLGDKTLGAAASQHRASIRRELEVLDGIAREVTDSRFKAVYEKDLDLHREAIQLLTDDPAVIFAVMVKSTYSNLARIDDLPAVRYVEFPEDSTATISNHSFAPLVPEDTETAGFALK
jgi:hypothetical protein